MTVNIIFFVSIPNRNTSDSIQILSEIKVQLLGHLTEVKQNFGTMKIPCIPFYTVCCLVIHLANSLNISFLRPIKPVLAELTFVGHRTEDRESSWRTPPMLEVVCMTSLPQSLLYTDISGQSWQHDNLDSPVMADIRKLVKPINFQQDGKNSYAG